MKYYIIILSIILIAFIAVSFKSKPATEIVRSETVIVNKPGLGLVTVYIAHKDMIVEVPVMVNIECDSLKNKLKRI